MVIKCRSKNAAEFSKRCPLVSVLSCAFFQILQLLIITSSSLVEASPLESSITEAFVKARKEFGQRSKAGLFIYRINDSKKLYSFAEDSFDEKTPLLIASASKWVSTAIIMRLVEKGILSLSSTVGEYFAPLQSNVASITLEQLLSFQSGLSSSRRNPCADTSDLQSCAMLILKGNPSEPPSIGFRYGNVHLSVAAAMAERATRMSWNALVIGEFVRPLQVKDTCYYTNALNEELAETPLVAGGLLISTRDYLTFLGTIAKQGMHEGQVWLNRRSVRELLTSRFKPSTKVLSSPFHQNGKIFYEYALGNWVECDSKECAEPRNSSPGYYGFYPWIDEKAGYYAVLATKAWLLDARASVKSAQIVDQIRPLIEKLAAASS